MYARTIDLYVVDFHIFIYDLSYKRNFLKFVFTFTIVTLVNHGFQMVYKHLFKFFKFQPIVTVTLTDFSCIECLDFLKV